MTDTRPFRLIDGKLRQSHPLDEGVPIPGCARNPPVKCNEPCEECGTGQMAEETARLRAEVERLRAAMLRLRGLTSAMVRGYIDKALARKGNSND